MPLDNFSAYSRQELAAVNDLIAEGTTARDQARQMHDRLEQPTRLLGEVLQEYAVEKALHDAAIAAWYGSGCPGDRPDLPSRMIELERQIGDLRRDLGASMTALEIAASGLQAANEHLAELHIRHRGALYRAAVEAAAWRLRTRAVPVLIAKLAEFDVVESLEVELRNRGFGPDPHPEALSASEAIRQLIATVRQSVGVKGNPDAARRFLDDLAQNPDAELPDPGGVSVEWSEPRSPPVPYINRAIEGEVPLPVLEGVHDPFWENPTRAAVMAREAGLVGNTGGQDANTVSPPLAETGIPVSPLVPMPETELPAWLEPSSPTFMPSPRSPA